MIQQHRPSLVILDVGLPGRTGLDILREIKSDPNLARTPVILHTAAAQESDIRAGLVAGADSYQMIGSVSQFARSTQSGSICGPDRETECCVLSRDRRYRTVACSLIVPCRTMAGAFLNSDFEGGPRTARKPGSVSLAGR